MPRVDPSKKLQRRFGQRCLELRKERGWSQLDMVRRHDVTLSYWQRVEGGKLDVRLSTLNKIASWFDVTLAQLLDPID